MSVLSEQVRKRRLEFNELCNKYKRRALDPSLVPVDNSILPETNENVVSWVEQEVNLDTQEIHLDNSKVESRPLKKSEHGHYRFKFAMTH